MAQETVAEVLDIERQAVQMVEEARHRAQRILRKAEKEADDLRREILEDARREADRVVAQGREEAQEVRERILSEAEEEARRLGSSAEPNLDRAVSFLLDQVAGRE